jgi:hypothetical protein
MLSYHEDTCLQPTVCPLPNIWTLTFQTRAEGAAKAKQPYWNTTHKGNSYQEGIACMPQAA